jgi:hypothetical protein
LLTSHLIKSVDNMLYSFFPSRVPETDTQSQGMRIVTGPWELDRERKGQVEISGAGCPSGA